ncbi:hypothetical protein [Armatimonas sp.]|uniref:hypothetical protein n=1 Tax=Armatimonas sp. TaxID=1872638 RepID=UPI00286A1ADF|nr:hypothetical protein [Armatimonas sp.]
MTPLEAELLDFLLPAPGAAWTPAQAQAFLNQKGTRSAVYLVVGLLIRNQQSDAARAAAVLELLVNLQKRLPGMWLGVWPGDNGTTGRMLDHNWREFIGVGLIVARERYGKLLPKALIEKIDAALVIAAEGDIVRNVSPEYTNIALMSAFLQEWVGATLGKPEIAAKGAEKARQVAALFNQSRTFTEDNSPTYGGVDAMGLALWRELSPSKESRAAASAMEAAFWRDTAQLYHAGLRNLCGPFTRAYGMDMVQYTAITGVAILLLTQDKKTAPAPSDWNNRSFEWAYAPMFLALGLRCPPDALAHFKAFEKPRRLERKVPRNGKAYPVQCVLEKNWMMGATVGLTRAWEQHAPGTIHWRMADGSTGWLLVHGTNGVEVKLVGDTMQIVLPRRTGERLRLLLHAPGCALGGPTWNLNGLRVKLETTLGEKSNAVVTDKHFGKALEVSWALPVSLPPGTILTLTVVK